MASSRLAVDLITFYHPAFWGVETTVEVNNLAEADPKGFWDKMLSAIEETGVTGVECTFGPFSVQMAIRAYGSVEAVKTEMTRRGLIVISAFVSGFERHGDVTDPATRTLICAEVLETANIVAALGGSALVAGLPMRKTKGEAPIAFVDLDFAAPFARLCNELGAAIAPLGLTLALHTESHSVMCTARDVDLFMMLTDPLYVGLCPDSAHLVLSGADPIAVLDRHKDRLVVSHWKDATGPMPLDVPIDETIHTRHRPYFCKLGMGRVNWPAWACLHRDAGFDGWKILEVDATADPVATIRESREFVDTALSHLLS